MSYSLHPYHTFHLNVNADCIVEVRSSAQLLAEWQSAQLQQQPVLLLGQGSNVLFLEDFAGKVLINKLHGIDHREDQQNHYLHIAGGESWHNLVQWSLARGIAGLENLALIPGCVGSAPIQNIGAYGIEFEQVCDFVDVLNLNTGETFRLDRTQCEFGYRDSIFKHQYQHGFAIIAVGLTLPKAWKPVLTYGSLATLDPNTVTPQQIFDEVCALRSSKLPDPNEFGNAGSFFKNPIIDFAKSPLFSPPCHAIPHYPQPDGSVKLPAGWLIEQCQLKGFQLGGAAVHTKQALVLINKDHATGQDVLALAKTVRRHVREKFGVELHPEVRFIGKTGEVDSEALTR